MRTTTRYVAVLGLMAGMFAPSSAPGQSNPVLPGFSISCWISEGASTSITVRVCNRTGGNMTGITPSTPDLVFTGTAALQYITMPSFRREMDSGNCNNFKWTVRTSGCGTIDIAVEGTGEDESGVTYSTGFVDCGRLTPEAACYTPTPTRTPILTPTLRPTRTRLPTATPRTRLPTPTPRTRLPSPTPRPRLATPTPKPPKDVEPSQTPAPTNTRRAALPTMTPRTPLPTNTPRTPLPTKTARPPLPTPTPKGPHATLRPTRTPLATRTPLPYDLSRFTGRCIAVPGHAFVPAVNFEVFNNTGADLTDVTVETIELDTTGDATVTAVHGPFPGWLAVLLDRHSDIFRWTLRTAGNGQLFIHVRAYAFGPNGEFVSTDRIECNTLNIPPRVTF